MTILDDADWRRLKAALDAARSGTGRPFADERRTVEAVIWRQRNGAKWRAVPPALGPWWKAAQLHIRRSRMGIWARAFELLRDSGRPELGEVFLDGTSVRARQKAAGAKGGRARRRSARSVAWSATAATPPNRGALPSTPSAPSRSSPAIRRTVAPPLMTATPTAIGTASRTSGPGSRNGAPSPPDTTRPPPASSAHYISPRRSTGCLTGLGAQP